MGETGFVKLPRVGKGKYGFKMQKVFEAVQCLCDVEVFHARDVFEIVKHIDRFGGVTSVNYELQRLCQLGYLTRERERERYVYRYTSRLRNFLG